MTATFPGGVKAFTTKNAGDEVDESHVNDLQDEVAAVETGTLRMHFGDGSDGATDMNGSNTFAAFATLGGSTYTLTRDIYPTALTVRAGITLKTDGFKIFAANSITVEATGIVSNAGADGSAGSVATGGTAGASGGGGSTKAPPAAQNGGNQEIAGAAGANEAVSAGGANGIAGAAGGGEGHVGGAENGGAAGVATALPAASGGIHNLTAVSLWRAFGAAAVVSFGYHAGNGGAGGGYTGDGAGGGGGGGGGNGGYLVLFSPVLANAGSITVNGGDGGAGGAGGANADGGGGGAGGNGGIVAIACLSRTGNTPTVAGGSGGAAGSGTGSGFAGDAGSPGLNGLIIELKPA